MAKKPTYEELEQKVKELENKAFDRKRDEEAPQESEQRYRLIMEASLQGTYQVDAKGRMTFASPETAELTGYSLAELDGLPLDTLFPPGEAMVISNANVALLYSGKPIVGENTLTRKDGSRIEIYFSCAPVSDESGEYAGFVGSILDITDRKQAEEALRESEGKYRSLIGNIPGVSYRCRCDEHWTMEFISDEVKNLTGYPASDFLQNAVRSWTSIMHPEDKETSDEYALGKINRKEPEISEDIRVGPQ